MSAGGPGSRSSIWVRLFNKDRDLTFGTHARLEHIYKVCALEKPKAIKGKVT